MPMPTGLVDRIGSLDPLPITLQRLVGLLGDENVSFDAIVEVVEQDQAMSANVLRIANSSLYGGRYEVSRMRDAVVRLGTGALLNVAFGGHVRKMVVPAPLYDMSENDLWLHALVASTATGLLGRFTSEKVQLPAVASLAGLLHDIGKLVMVRYLDEKPDELRALAEKDGVTWIEAERRLFGCDHAEVGGEVARAWQFPTEIAEAIEHHHDYPMGDTSPLIDAVVVGNLVTKMVGVGLGAEGLNLAVERGSLDRLGLTFEDFCRVCAETAWRLEAIRGAYGVRA